MRALSRDFTLLIGALLVGSVVTCVAGLFGLSRLDSSLEAVVTIDMPRLMTITDLRKQIRMLVVAENDHILEPNAEKAELIENGIRAGTATITQLFARYQPYLLAEDARTWDALRADVKDWWDLHERVLGLSRARRVPEAAALSKTHSKVWEAVIKDLIANADKHLQIAAASTRRVSSNARVTVFAVFAISALLGLVAGLVIYRAIRGALREVVALKDRLVTANAGLERTVDDRTRQIRAILDHVHFGFFLVDRELRITDGYTRSLSRLLGTGQLAGRLVSECLGFTGGSAVDFEVRVSQIFDDFLPEELNCNQVPTRAVRGEQVLGIQVSAVRDATGQVAQVLFGISDVTNLEAAERENRNNQTLLRALKDPEPFRRFVADLSARFDSVRDAVQTADQPRARRELHTIKGNASVYGLTDLAARTHELEEHSRIGLLPVLDLEQELTQFLRCNEDVLGIDHKAADREIYRIDSEALSDVMRAVHDAPDLATLRQALIEKLERLRWQPVARLLGPLAVQVTNLADRLGKDVSLQVTGGDVSVLPSRIAPVLAVLPHMLRNAIDHGIELYGCRGDKPAHGALQLTFRDVGHAWQFEVRDDGRGLDVDRLHDKAVELGIIEPTAALSHDQLCALVFAPRLSTATGISDISGRGEGLAAVAEAVRLCDGTIAVSSTRGVGTTFLLEIPKAARGSAAAQPRAQVGGVVERELASRSQM